MNRSVVYEMFQHDLHDLHDLHELCRVFARFL